MIWFSGKTMDIPSYNINDKYPCCPGIKCDGFTYLMYLIAYQDQIDNIENEILKNLTNINHQNSLGWTALMIACGNTKIPNIKLIKLLLENGADTNIQNNIGNNSVMVTFNYSSKNKRQNYRDNSTIIKLLIDYGANVNLMNNHNSTALIMASRYSKFNKNYEIVKLLLKHNADPNIVNKNGGTALTLSVFRVDIDSNIETVKLLIDNGADLNIFIDDINLLYFHLNLTRIRKFNNIEVFKLLLKRGCNPNLGDNGRCVLSHSIRYLNDNSLEIIKLLLEHGADINIRHGFDFDPYGVYNLGNTPLISAIQYYKSNPKIYKKIIKLLLFYGANVNIKNADFQNAFIISILFECPEDITFLIMRKTIDFFVKDYKSKIILFEINDKEKYIKEINRIAKHRILIKKLHISIINDNAHYTLKPDSIRVKMATIRWYYNQGHNYDDIFNLDPELFDYFGIFDMEILKIKLLDNCKYL
ncbi:putative ankyrin repeat protein [Cotonvirus japonicus]|uniref:Ankyrin repeat protein n=1 Tax=Cotonvirus japonicus TaxID=2811091 RepID=A0ABM7NRH4_9VIRU|nr:putative ankyrin repeat protein [Cotonvirus japonicus]BCS82696.1 putative ankyrin repeat protein [Cotonvirus japonicus]